jgi:hypothetical protein
MHKIGIGCHRGLAPAAASVDADRVGFPTLSRALLARLLVLGGVLIVVGSFQTWAVFSVSPVFDWDYYPSGLDLGFGIITALFGIGIASVGSSAPLGQVRWPQTAFGLALASLVLVGFAMAVAMYHDPSDGLSFDGIGLGALAVAVGAVLAGLAAWRLWTRVGEPAEPGPRTVRPLWQGAAIVAGGLLLWTEGMLFVLHLAFHAATGRSSQGPNFLGMDLEAWDSYFGVSGHHVGWEVAYVAFAPIALAAIVAALVLLRGREWPALAVAAAWFAEAVVFSVGGLRLSGFFWTQLLVLVLIAVGTWPQPRAFVRWTLGRPAHPRSRLT